MSIGSARHCLPTDVAVDLSVRLCSYRFMDMFPDTAMVRKIQQELDDTIQEGVLNITRLIRATDSTITDMQGNVGTPSSNNVTGSKGQRGQRGSGVVIDSSLASRLVRDGLLTPDLLRQLQREWSKDTDDKNNDNKGKRKRKKKWRGALLCVDCYDRRVPMEIDNWLKPRVTSRGLK